MIFGWLSLAWLDARDCDLDVECNRACVVAARRKEVMLMFLIGCEKFSGPRSVVRLLINRTPERLTPKLLTLSAFSAQDVDYVYVGRCI